MAEQRVVKRKTHTKSRKGCFQCKQRHSKCNEERPRCSSCIRLNIPCDWPSVTNSYSQPKLAVSPMPVEGQTSGGSDPTFDAFKLSLPDMRLVHHWTSRCYKSMHATETIHEGGAWQNGFIQLGFEHPFLLHGLLALSAVHMASFLLPMERQSLLLQADSHISRALETYRKFLESPTEDTAIPMFILSSVLLTYNFGSIQEQPEDPINSLHHSFMLLQGIKFLFARYWDKINDSAVFAAMTESTSASMLKALDRLSKDDQNQDVSRLIELTELVLDVQDKTACAGAVNELHKIWLRYHHLSPEHDEYALMFLWPARLTSRFFDLLAAHNPVACIITTYFAALMAQGRPVWYVVKWPRWLLTATEQLLAGTPYLLKWLQWPQLIINSKGKY